MKASILRWSVLTVFLGVTFAPSAFAARYGFAAGHTVLDEYNSPGIGANLAATCGLERGIAFDPSRGLIYIARGGTTTGDGRASGVEGVAVIKTHEVVSGSSYTDTGLLIASSAAGTPALGFHQSLAFDRTAERLYVFGGGAVATPTVFSAEAGIVGGAPNGLDSSAVNRALEKEFQVTAMLDLGETSNRGGTPRGLAVLSVEGTPTVYLAMGHHVQACRRDEVNPTNWALVGWRRLWATVRAPQTTNVNNRATDSRVNGIDVDDEGNCFFNVGSSAPARVWMVPAGIETNQEVNPLFLDFADRALGGTNTSANALVLPIIPTAAPGVDFRNPQDITYCRIGTRKVLFVSVLPAATIRGVARLTVDTTPVLDTNGFPYVSAKLIDAFGSGQPATNQDSTLMTLSLKRTNAAPQLTQPYGATQGLLYHDVNTRANPAYLFINAFLTDSSKDQTIPHAAIAQVAIASLPPESIVPVILVQPQAQAALVGGSATFEVTADGAAPLAYQWQLNSNNIPDATNASIALPSLQAAQSGYYRCVVTNEHGEARSADALLTVTPLVSSGAMTNLWRLAPGSRPYLTANDTQRGLTHNATGNSLLLVSRADGTNVYVLDAETGADLHVLDVTGVSGGTYSLNAIAAAEDGAVYAANLTLNGSADSFRIYQWESDAAGFAPALAYSGNPGGADRWGDTLDARGQGTETQILATSRNGTNAVIFTTDDGFHFSAHLIATDALAGDMGLGAVFGAGNTFWTKSSSRALREIQFDLGTGKGVTLTNYGAAAFPNSVYVIGLDPAMGLLGGVSIENPDNLRLYSIADRTVAPQLLDQELFATDNPNANGTGAVDFGFKRLYALDSNNGLLAMALPDPVEQPRLGIERNGSFVTLTWSGAFILQSSTNVAGGYADVPGAVSGHAEDTTGQPRKYYRLRN